LNAELFLDRSLYFNSAGYFSLRRTSLRESEITCWKNRIIIQEIETKANILYFSQTSFCISDQFTGLIKLILIDDPKFSSSLQAYFEAYGMMMKCCLLFAQWLIVILGLMNMFFY
jgi:hypothetical protein